MKQITIINFIILVIYILLLVISIGLFMCKKREISSSIVFVLFNNSLLILSSLISTIVPLIMYLLACIFEIYISNYLYWYFYISIWLILVTMAEHFYDFYKYKFYSKNYKVVDVNILTIIINIFKESLNEEIFKSLHKPNVRVVAYSLAVILLIFNAVLKIESLLVSSNLITMIDYIILTFIASDSLISMIAAKYFDINELNQKIINDYEEEQKKLVLKYKNDIK